MANRIDKRIRAENFRSRLLQAMADNNMTQSALSRAIGVDRSTVSQLITGDGARLPNAQVIGECASVLKVSADWLLSLSERPERAADLLAHSLELTRAPRALVDEQIFDWHREAAGYKIRHVPATLPDMFKTDALLEWEYTPHLGKTTQQAMGASRDRLNWMAQSNSDYEIAMPVHELHCFATAEGYYRDLPIEVRLAQLDRLLELSERFYPRVRIYLFDARQLFSSPITIFGPLLSVLYVGQHYLAFRDSERIAAFTEHFDNLVRQANVGTRDLSEFLIELKTYVD